MAPRHVPARTSGRGTDPGGAATTRRACGGRGARSRAVRRRWRSRRRRRRTCRRSSAQRSRTRAGRRPSRSGRSRRRPRRRSRRRYRRRRRRLLPCPNSSVPRSLTTTDAPSAASRRAMALPMPFPAPVTSAARPFNRSANCLPLVRHAVATPVLGGMTSLPLHSVQVAVAVVVVVGREVLRDQAVVGVVVEAEDFFARPSRPLRSTVIDYQTLTSSNGVS